MKLKKKRLIEAAKELNKTLGLQPEIDVNQDVEGLKEEILVAAELLEPGDDISEETEEVINLLMEENGESSEEEEEEEETEEAGAEEEEAAEGSEPEEEGKEPEPEPAPKAAPPKKETEEKAAPKPKKEKKEKAEPAITRSHAAGLAIRDGRGKTISELIKLSDEIYVKHGGSSNLKESKTRTIYAIRSLEAFGAIKVKGDKVV